MAMTPHSRAASIFASAIIAAGLAVPAFASAASPFAPPPPPEAGSAGAPQEMSAASPLEQFRPTLQQFGSFHAHPLYGTVWRPSEQAAPAGWSPYPVCHWQYDREQRTWTFNDPTEWGSIVHHHGRWANDPQLGWVWVADANYGPGWVFWRTEAAQVSWAPMLPDQHGNQPPRDGWQSQDQASFNSGCRQSPPAAPVAGFVPPPAAVPAPMIADGGPAFVPGRPIFVTGRPPMATPGRPPLPGGLPPACSTGIRPSWCRPVCAVRPTLPGCRRPGPVLGGGHPLPGAAPGSLGSICSRNPAHPACHGMHRPFRPGSVLGGHPLPGAAPGTLGSICSRNPAHPACHGMHRPFRPGLLAGRPGPRPGTFAGRPGSHRPFVARFGGGPRIAMGQGGFGHRIARR